MTPEKFRTIQSALKLQGDLKIMFTVKAGLSELAAEGLATHIMDMVLKSDAVRPEIAAIYKEIEDGIE